MRALICVILSVFIFAGCATGRNQDDSKPVKIKNLKRDSDGIYRVPKAKPIKLKQEKVGALVMFQVGVQLDQKK